MSIMVADSSFTYDFQDCYVGAVSPYLAMHHTVSGTNCYSLVYDLFYTAFKVERLQEKKTYVDVCILSD